jgi:hypothetical protein
MKAYVQWSIVLWASALGLLTLFSSIVLLASGSRNVTPVPLTPPPTPPDPLVAKNMDAAALTAYTQQVAAYTQQVAAYQQQIAAHKAYVDASLKSNASSVYTIVIKDTLGPYLTQLLIGLLGYAFVKAGATAINNINLARHNQPPEPLKPFD